MKYTLDIGCGYDKKQHVKKGDIGIDVRTGLCDVIATAYYLPFCNNCLKKVIMSHVLEHLDDPLKVLKEIDRVLARKGLLEIEIPNAHSFYIFKDILLKRKGRLKISSEHIHLFGETELSNLLLKAGFKLIKITYVNSIWTQRLLNDSFLKYAVYSFIWMIYPAFKNAIRAEFKKG